MSYVGTYLNFPLQTEEAFNFYKSVFNPDAAMSIMRFSDMPFGAELPENERNGVMHAALQILDGHWIYGTDMLESMGHKVKIGNNTTLSLNLDSLEQADELYAKLSVGSTEQAPPHQEPWGYWGVCLDRFGVRWMFNVDEPSNS